MAEVVEEFNMYFGSVFTNESDHVTPETPLTVSCTKIEDLEFTEEDIRKKLLKIREDKAPGADDISPRLLCHIVNEIFHPLFIIFRRSLDEGIVPDDWKRANVSPLF